MFKQISLKFKCPVIFNEIFYIHIDKDLFIYFLFCNSTTGYATQTIFREFNRNRNIPSTKMPAKTAFTMGM